MQATVNNPVYDFWFANQKDMKIKEMADHFGVKPARFSQMINKAIAQVQYQTKQSKQQPINNEL